MENQINKIFNLENTKEYQDIFLTKKKINIPNILNEHVAQQFFKYIILEKNWNLSTGIDGTKYQKKVGKPFEKANGQQIKKINDKFKDDHFTYIFHRTLNNQKPSYIEFSIRKMMGSQEFIDYLNQITHLNLTQLNTIFISKYKSGHFLSPHSDKGNGKLAFVLNLTQGWKPQYGGILHFLNTDKSEIVDTICPQFNQLTLFEVPEEGIPHFVSHVAPGIKKERFAITGWYN